MPEDASEGPGALTYLKAGSILLIGVAVMVLITTAFIQDPPDDPFWFSVFMLSIGGAALFLGFRELRDRQLILNTPTSKVRSLAVGDVEVKGKTHPVDEPLVSPLSNTEACAYELEVRKATRQADGKEWKDALEIRNQVPFHVDDGTGRVRVEPAEATFTIEEERELRVDARDPLPDELTTWARSEDAADLLDMNIPREEGGDSGLGKTVTDTVESMVEGKAKRHFTEESSNDRIYIERVLGVGEQAYVFGGAYPHEEGAESTANPDNLVIREHAGTGRFIVSDKSERALAQEGLVSISLLLAMGIAVVPPGLIALTQAVGVL